MTEAKHTPGPWTDEDNHSYNGMLRLIGSDGRNGGIYIAHVIGPNCEANARLIAAAPDMLAALKAFVTETDGTYPFESLPGARAAIAKAEGRS